MREYLANSGLDTHQIEIFSSIFTEKKILKSGDYFVKEGQIANYLGFVIKGTCRYFHNTFGGDEITRWMALENDFTTSLPSN